METTTEHTRDGIILTVSGSVTIADACELREVMIQEALPASNVTIDLSGVAECDLSLFQLLCAAHRRSLAASGSMTVRNYSGEVYETMASAGIQRSLSCTGNENENCLWHEARQR